MLKWDSAQWAMKIIVKGSDRMQQSKGETRQKWRRWMAAGAVLLTVLAKLLWPEIGDGLRHLMMGPDGNAVEQAFCGLCGQLESGGSMESAISAFCQGVFYEN